MFHTNRKTQFDIYRKARTAFIADPSLLIDLEQFLADRVASLLRSNVREIAADYNEACYLYPFWQNYPPDDRGRAPRGDQFPWIEVGEHAIGDRLPFLLKSSDFEIRNPGIPTGADERFVLRTKRILELTKGITDSAFLFIDIKSVGPRDDADHTVMSHNQVSGDGKWDKVEDGIKNTVLRARGALRSHDFHCVIPPLYVLSDKTIVPVVILALKPVYSMVADGKSVRNVGQPLSRLDIAAIPNGLLLLENPRYLTQYPGLFYPGKDDKGKNPLKVRARVSFELLRTIAKWRHQVIEVPLP